MRSVRCACLLIALQPPVVQAQAPPDLAGTWKLDPSRSRIDEASVLAGLAKTGAPAMLHVTLARNGTLVVESPTNESHARLYRPGSPVSTPVSVGQPGSISVTSRWDGRSLVSEGTREFSGSPAARVKEVLAVSSDGRTLTLEITTTTAGAASVSSLTYTRTQSVGPCQSWPTPCKTPAK